MHVVSRILGFFHYKWLRAANIMKCTALQKIPFGTKHVHLNPKTHEVEMVCVHAQWRKHHVFRLTTGCSF